MFVISVYQYLWKGNFIDRNSPRDCVKSTLGWSICAEMPQYVSKLIRRASCCAVSCRAGEGYSPPPIYLKPRRIDKI